jgi:DNA invertase Pin-like site-specific DNA recombinase
MTSDSLPSTAPADSATLAVTYSAKSTLDLKGSIATQRADTRLLAQRNGWQLAGEYSDEDASAYHASRGKGLLEAKAHAERLSKAGHQVVIVVQHADRLARGDGVTADHLVEIALWARKAGVRITSVQDPGTFEGGLAFAAMMGDRSHEDSRRKGLAVKDGMKRRRQQGLHAGGPAKYGYDYQLDEFGRPAPLPLALNECEAEVVKRMFTEAAAGTSQKEITRRLNRDGIKAKRGGTWTQGTISKLLSDPQYAGFTMDATPTQAPAIVSLALFKQVETVRVAGRKSQGGPRGRQTSGRHLLVNGHLRCGQCGGSMIPRTGSQKRSPDGKPWGSRYERYLCASHLADPASCPQTPVKRAVIDDAILSYLLQVGLDFQATKLQYDEIANQRVTQAKQLLAQAEREVMRIEVAQQRVESDYLAGELSAGNWERLQDRLSAELGAAGALRDRLAAQTTPRPSDRLQDAESAVLNRFAELRRAVAGQIGSAEDVQALRAILVRLFERFTFHAGRRSQINAELLEGGNHLNTTIGFLRPVPRPDMIEVGLHQYGWSPHRQSLEPPLNNDAVGLPSASKSRMALENLFGEIPVEDLS